MKRVILADNQDVFRTGLAKLLSMEDDFRIIAQCPDIECLQTALATFREATIIFSSSLKQDPGPLMQQICGFGDRGVAVLENGEAPEAYLAAHVHGICFRGVSGRSLVESLRRVSRGERVLQSRSGTSSTGEFDEDLVGARVRDRLTGKEMKIVSLIMQGCKNKEIALRLGTTHQVIKNALRGIYDKTGVSDRLELALFAIYHRNLAQAAADAGKLILTSA